MLVEKFIFLTENMFRLGLAVIGFSLIITVHEFGHFIFCKIFGVRTPSFSIGFGPKILEKKIGDTVFAISAIPAGGYVEVAGYGEIGQGEQSEAHRDDEKSFSKKPYWQKMVIIMGGIAFNLIFSFMLLSFLYYKGMPQSGLLQQLSDKILISEVTENSPAQKAGLQKGDLILQIDNKKVTGLEVLLQEISQKANQKAELTIQRDGNVQNIPVEFEAKKEDPKSGFLGVAFTSAAIPPHGFLESIKKGLSTTIFLSWSSLKSIIYIFKTKSFNKISGPIGILSMAAKSIQAGFLNLLILIAVLSIAIATLNVLPLPILDGGQALINTIEAIIGRPISENIKYAVQIVSVGLFLLLLLYASYNDILAIAKNFITKLR